MRLLSSSYGQTGLNALFGRADVCDVAFPGEAASTDFCSPSNTLCCVRKGQQYPACQTGVSKGWCCTGIGTSNCYVDQPSSCDEPNAVPCTNLKKGVSKACCPRLTSCSDVYEASTRAAGAGSDSTQSSGLLNPSGSPDASASGTQTGPGLGLTPLPGIPVPSSTASTPPGPSPTPGSSSTITTAAIAGICVSTTLAFVLLVVLIWIILRRRRKALAEKEKASAQPDTSQDGSDQDLHDQTGSRDLGNPPDYLPELPHDHTRSKAPGDTRPYSYFVGQNGVGYYKPMELMTERVVPVELQGNAQMGYGVPGHHWQEQFGPFKIMTNPRGSGVMGTPRAELPVPTPWAELGTFI